MFDRAPLSGSRVHVNILSALHRAVDFASYLVFGEPAECALCGAYLPDSHLFWPVRYLNPGTTGISFGVCPGCLAELRLEMFNVCRICGIPLRPPLTLCPRCQRTGYYFDLQRSAGLYRGKLAAAIRRMKFGGHRWLSRPLGSILAGTVQTLMPVDLLVPVPADSERVGRRGFNQAADLAIEVSWLLHIPVSHILTRKSRTAHQVGLDRRDRWRNLRMSMGVRKPADLTGASVVLIDDVMTTGATLSEAARVLKNLGAARVMGATLARTPEM